VPEGLRFGLFLGQVGHDWPSLLDRFQLAEELGYDHAWLVDHFVDTDGDLSKPCMEAWTLLAGLAARTSRIRLGVLVSSNTFRHPALLLKEAVTVDRISGGRLILGVGSGWHEPEHRMYGLPFPPAGERVGRLEEAVQVLDALMRQERTTFHGRYYQLEDAPFEPKPLQRPRIPLLIAAHRPRMLRLAARYADVWDTFPPIPGAATEGTRDSMEARLRALEGYCREAGRDPAEIRRSSWTGGEVLRSEEAFLGWVRGLRALGFTDFTTGLPGPAQMDSVRRVAAQVLPALRAGEL
jgi:F420-dependent oxidoreductase-like protein